MTIKDLAILTLFTLWASPLPAQDPAAEICEESHDSLQRSVVFVNGYEKLEQMDFDAAARWMDCADGTWPEDKYYNQQEDAYIRVNRYTTKPYLPRYYLGKSLYKAGCYASAREKLNKTLLLDEKSSAYFHERHLGKDCSRAISKLCLLTKAGACKKPDADCSLWPSKAEYCSCDPNSPDTAPQGGE